MSEKHSSPKPVTDRVIDNDVDEPTTNPGAPVDVDYLKRKLGELEKDVEGALVTHDNKLTVRSVVVAVFAVAASVITAILFIDNRVQAQTDAGVKVHEQRITTLEQERKADRAEVNDRLERLEKNQNADHDLNLGTSQKLDKLLERMQVPNPSPAPKDGGP